MSLITFAVIIFIAAQFHPKGQAFLASETGAAATVTLAALAILSMLPSALMLNPLNILLIGLWGWIAYPRLPAAKRWFQSRLRLPR